MTKFWNIKVNFHGLRMPAVAILIRGRCEAHVIDFWATYHIQRLDIITVTNKAAN